MPSEGMETTNKKTDQGNPHFLTKKKPSKRETENFQGKGVTKGWEGEGNWDYLLGLKGAKKTTKTGERRKREN